MRFLWKITVCIKFIADGMLMKQQPDTDEIYYVGNVKTEDAG